MHEGAVQVEEVTHLVTSLHRLAARFDPDAIPSGDVRGTIEDLGQAKRLVEGMLTALARRAVEVSTAPTSPGAAGEAAVVLAAATGTTTGQARRTLVTSRRLAEQPEVAVALRHGALSKEQADVVSDAVEASPESGQDLLDAAKKQSLADLKRTCRDHKALADRSPDITRERHRQQRSCKTWLESDGEWKAMLSGPADVGARFEAAVRGEHDAIFREAHASDRHEPSAAYKLDAVLALLERSSIPQSRQMMDSRTHPTPAEDGRPPGGPGRATPAQTQPSRRSGRQTKVIVTVDAQALRRGSADPGETCHIAGVGRVGVAAVKRLIPDAHIAYVIRDAATTSVAHLGRQATARQRTALEARGYECEVPDCRSTHLLEIDHVRDWAFSRRTQLEHLAWLCPEHHRQKSRFGHVLSGPPDRRAWHRPDGSTRSSDIVRTKTIAQPGPVRQAALI